MTDPAKTEAKPEAPKKSRTRSPDYPYIDLQKAIERARLLYNYEKKHPVSTKVIAEHWKIKPTSSGLLLTISALKKYGLLVEAGVGHSRISDLAFRILADERPESPERDEAIVDAALLPDIHAQLWQKYQADLPPDPALRTHLIMDRGFNAAIVDSFIKDYRATISFAKLGKGVSVARQGQNGLPAVVQQGVANQNRGSNPQINVNNSGMMSEIPVFLDSNKFVKIPYPLTEDDYSLLLDQLKLLKKRLVPEKPKDKDKA